MFKSTLISILLLSSVVGLFLLDTDLYSKNQLQQELDQLAEQFKQKIDPKTSAILKAKKDALSDSKILDSVIQVGAQMPEGEFLDPKKNKITLSQLLSKKNSVIVFYRGGWCPYCNLQLKHYQSRLNEFQAAGAQLIAISPELPDATLTTQQKHALKFQVLSDPQNSYAKKLGIVFKLDAELKKIYQSYGIDLDKNQGSSAWELPLAAAFVVDTQSKIHYVFKDVDYKKRANVEALIVALKKIEL